VNIFHIVSIEAWDAALASGIYRADSLATEGFIHFSYAEQVSATANRRYQGSNLLQVLEVDPALLGVEVRVELSPATGEQFPHCYGPLPIAAVVAIYPLHRDEAGSYVF
jgi:uncharacterized protein (DUF952 family)